VILFLNALAAVLLVVTSAFLLRQLYLWAEGERRARRRRRVA
jgi:hypothetical protein